MSSSRLSIDIYIYIDLGVFNKRQRFEKRVGERVGVKRDFWKQGRANDGIERERRGPKTNDTRCVGWESRRGCMHIGDRPREGSEKRASVPAGVWICVCFVYVPVGVGVLCRE